MALDDCIQWIVSLVETEDPNAFRLSVAEADAYLASFDDVRGPPEGPPSGASNPSKKGWTYRTDRALPKPDISSATDRSEQLTVDSE